MLHTDAASRDENAAEERLPGNARGLDPRDPERWLMTARPRLARLAQLRGVAPDAIEDVVQETLLEAWKHQDRVQTPDGFPLWLDEVCRNVCRRHARKHFSEQRHRLASAPDADGARGEAEGALLNRLPDLAVLDPAEALSRQDLALLLDRALGSLSRSAREVVELCYLIELPQREVAQRLGLSISALEARLHRARQRLRELLNGPLRDDAEALGLAVDQESAGGWRETRLWCTLCGRRRLLGVLLPQADGGTNLHMQCPECDRQYGLSDVHSSNVHSKGLVELAGLTSFRPAWKRTMDGITQRLLGALRAAAPICPSCGGPASVNLVDAAPAEHHGEKPGALELPGVARHPSQFWLWWGCPRCHGDARTQGDVFAASDLVYWSHPLTRRFMADHPHWISEPELLVECAGQPALRLRMADVTSAARLTVLAHRQTLAVLAVFE
ncbi:MAG TPA: sigma-70 family RNA polymerase sigma factor [Ktedonobacterales bacterium]